MYKIRDVVLINLGHPEFLLMTTWYHAVLYANERMYALCVHLDGWFHPEAAYRWITYMQ